MNVDYTNFETVSAEDINCYQIGGDNQKAGSGNQDYIAGIATRAFRGNIFANCADPQIWLQSYREQSTPGGSGVHKTFFQEINTGALNSTFITYHASRS